MNPDTWRVTPVTPDLVGQTVLVEIHTGELVKARVEAVLEHRVTVSSFGVHHDVDLSDGKHIWARVA